MSGRCFQLFLQYEVTLRASASGVFSGTFFAQIEDVASALFRGKTFEPVMMSPENGKNCFLALVHSRGVNSLI